MDGNRRWALLNTYIVFTSDTMVVERIHTEHVKRGKKTLQWDYYRNLYSSSLRKLWKPE